MCIVVTLFSYYFLYLITLALTGGGRAATICPQGREPCHRSSAPDCTGRRRETLFTERPASEEDSRNQLIYLTLFPKLVNHLIDFNDYTD
jgi:hypothetical protein